MNPYDELLRNRSKVVSHCAAMAFNATTWRMFRKKESTGIREFLRQHIGDGRRLAECKSKKAYDNNLIRIIQSFQQRFRMSKTHRHPNFGQAAKVVNLYVKHILMCPDYLVRARAHRRLERYAHVPLDSQILKRMWGDRKTAGHFRRELENSGICHMPALSKLEERDYKRMQTVLATAPRKKGIPTIAYDYFYAWRGK